MLTPTTEIEGADSLDALFKHLGQDALKDAQLKKALRELAKPLISSIRSKTPVDNGTLKRSIGIIKRIKSGRGRPFILVGPRYYKPWDGYHAHLQEVGKEVYNLPYEGQKFIYKAFQENKYMLNEKMTQYIIKTLTKEVNKKLKKLQG